MSESQAFVPASMPGAPALPQANLLPPHVFARRRVARVGVWLVLVVVLVLFVAIVASVGARWQALQAERDLVSVQDRNSSLIAQQQDYADVPLVLNELKARVAARDLGAVSEILWSDYLGALSAATPLNASIDSLSVTQASALMPAVDSLSGPLATPGTIGTISITGRAESIAVASDWQDALNLIPGIVDVEVTTIERADENGTPYYSVSAIMSVTSDAFANQYAQVDEGPVDDAATEDEEGGN